MGKRTYTAEEKAFLIDYIPGHTYQETIDEFERLFHRRLTAQIVNGCCNHWGVRTGTLGYFPKGHVPANKGKKIPPEKFSLAARATQFKKGVIYRSRPIGYERVLSDGEVEVKVAEPNVWMVKHRYIWQQHHGKIPPGCVILFRDGDRYNFDIDNLVCVTKAEQIFMSKFGVKWHDPETFDTLLLMAKVRMECVTRKKKNNS